MWIIPYRARPAAFHSFLQMQLRPGEPLWHASHGMRVATLTKEKAWGSLKRLGRAVQKEGVARTLGAIALTAAAIAALPSSLADLEWSGTEGWSTPELESIVLGLTPEHLVLVGIAQSKSPDYAKQAYAPMWVVRLAPEQLASVKLRMQEQKVLHNDFVLLSIGEGEDEERFHLAESDPPGNLAEARAIAARLPRVD